MNVIKILFFSLIMILIQIPLFSFSEEFIITGFDVTVKDNLGGIYSGTIKSGIPIKIYNIDNREQESLSFNNLQKMTLTSKISNLWKEGHNVYRFYLKSNQSFEGFFIYSPHKICLGNKVDDHFQPICFHLSKHAVTNGCYGKYIKFMSVNKIAKKRLPEI